MHFRLTYTGSPGSVTATLTDDEGSVLATESGLSNERAARRWARRVAREHKAAVTPASSRGHSVYTTISGHDAFNL